MSIFSQHSFVNSLSKPDQEINSMESLRRIIAETCKLLSYLLPVLFLGEKKKGARTLAQLQLQSKALYGAGVCVREEAI